MRSWTGAWGDFRVEADEYRDLDDERVLELSRVVARGKASGLDLEHVQSKPANLLHVRDSKVSKVVIYLDRDRALADLGIEG
ncbi:MAG TPA: hypothetical protein VGH93_01445 [Solirubrobacteraceae bacterium]